MKFVAALAAGFRNPEFQRVKLRLSLSVPRPLKKGGNSGFVYRSYGDPSSDVVEEFQRYSHMRDVTCMQHKINDLQYKNSSTNIELS